MINLTNYGLNSVSDKTSTLPNGNSDKSEEFNMGLEVPTSSPPKLSPTEITSPNPNLKKTKRKKDNERKQRI